jgi:hypothetical protein
MAAEPSTIRYTGLEAMTRLRCALLDDYQRMALSMADWDPLTDRVDVVLDAPLAAPATAAAGLDAAIDVAAAHGLGITVCHTSSRPEPPAELTGRSSWGWFLTGSGVRRAGTPAQTDWGRTSDSGTRTTGSAVRRTPSLAS